MSSLRTTLCISLLSLGLASCAGEESKAAPDATLDAESAADVNEHVGMIAAYLPYIAAPDTSDKYEPKRGDVDRATVYAANEIRHAANGLRQRLQRKGGATANALGASLGEVAEACADLPKPEALATCRDKVTALEAALAKAETDGGQKLARAEPGAITEAGKKSLEPYVEVRGPSDAEKTFMKKRGDAAIKLSGVASACEAAAFGLESTANKYEKRNEDLRLVAVTHHQAFQAQCTKMRRAEVTWAQVQGCEKKPDEPDCKIACGKANAMIKNGVPAAALENIGEDVEKFCKKD